jgi:hypothetical protein
MSVSGSGKWVWAMLWGHQGEATMRLSKLEHAVIQQIGDWEEEFGYHKLHIAEASTILSCSRFIPNLVKGREFIKKTSIMECLLEKMKIKALVHYDNGYVVGSDREVMGWRLTDVGREFYD